MVAKTLFRPPWSEDVTALKRTDAYRNLERIYDPSSGAVYLGPEGWYEACDSVRETYRMDNLELLAGDDCNLWSTISIEGAGAIY